MLVNIGRDSYLNIALADSLSKSISKPLLYLYSLASGKPPVVTKT